MSLNRKATEIENKIPDTAGFITAPEFKRLLKINFDARMRKATKSLSSNSQVDAAQDKNRKNI